MSNLLSAKEVLGIAREGYDFIIAINNHPVVILPMNKVQFIIGENFPIGSPASIALEVDDIPFKDGELNYKIAKIMGSGKCLDALLAGMNFSIYKHRL